MEEQSVTTNQVSFPTEVIDLPSRGVFYPESSPLRSGQIELHYMTAKHEDILTSPNLIQKGLVLDKLMDALIATKGVKAADLLLGDLNAVMIASRILGYGKDYQVSLSCPSCGNDVEQVINLADLQMENEPEPGTVPQFKVVLPVSKAEVTLRLLSRGDELRIEKEVKSLKKINTDIESETTTRLKAIIAAVNGDTSSATIWTFVDNMLVRDARYLREKYREIVPDINFNIEIDCTCGTDQKARLPIGADFFWPDARV